jgi:hypothetical protein
MHLLRMQAKYKKCSTKAGKALQCRKVPQRPDMEHRPRWGRNSTIDKIG